MQEVGSDGGDLVPVEQGHVVRGKVVGESIGTGGRVLKSVSRQHRGGTRQTSSWRV